MTPYVHTHFVGGVPDYRGAPRPALMDPEYQRLMDEHHEHSRAEYRYSAFMADVIRSRDWWRQVAGETLSYPDEIRKLFGAAASALGPVLGQAMQQVEHHRKANAAVVERLVALDKATVIDDGFSQRPQLDAFRDDKNRKIAESSDGCCGEGVGSNGVCLGVGVCPRVASAKQCAKFIEGYMDWLDAYGNETALAGDTARLGDDGSISYEVHDG